ncbi:NAD(P)H-dependent oxidoreductase [Kluyvera ascorbata]|uniref:NAD(P)H-dependent oxidoreductase n=1 Tax=Kluyvera ascorbata TaxID=51288 RepID=UPI002899E2EE|nr:NAD(P)H-dependent oxidoreductase [Kluyvera ascorbata]
MKTLVIVSHPYPEQSTAIKALQQAAERQDNVTVRNLESLYGSDMSRFDMAAEQQAAEQADRIVFLFPIHWFNLTPMIKAYLNQVWSYGWAFGSEWKLKGKEMQIVVTAGATAFTYTSDGVIKSSMEEVLTPMKASAYYIGMQYNQPLAFYEAMGKSQTELEQFQNSFVQCLRAPLTA